MAGVGTPAATVVVRTRPRFPLEKTPDGMRVETRPAEGRVLVQEARDEGSPRETSFLMDSVFGEDATNQEVYAAVVKPLVDMVVDGNNATVIAFGGRKAGKTATLLGFKDQRGVLSLAMADLFAALGKEPEGVTTRVKVTSCELVNETVRDLLEPSNKDQRVREDKRLGPRVDGLATRVLASAGDFDKVVQTTLKNRKRSSYEHSYAAHQSHAVMEVVVERSMEIPPANPDSGPPKVQTVSCRLLVVDLAGAGCDDNGEGNGEVLDMQVSHAVAVLKSVLLALSDPGQKLRASFSSSVLTKILYSTFVGDHHLLFLSHISPSPPSLGHCLDTLKHTSRARYSKRLALPSRASIKNAMESGEDDEAARYQTMIVDLKRKITSLRVIGEGNLEDDPDDVDETDGEELKVYFLQLQKNIRDRTTLLDKLRSAEEDSQACSLRLKRLYVQSNGNVGAFDDEDDLASSSGVDDDGSSRSLSSPRGKAFGSAMDMGSARKFHSARDLEHANAWGSGNLSEAGSESSSAWASGRDLGAREGSGGTKRTDAAALASTIEATERQADELNDRVRSLQARLKANEVAAAALKNDLPRDITVLEKTSMEPSMYNRLLEMEVLEMARQLALRNRVIQGLQALARDQRVRLNPPSHLTEFMSSNFVVPDVAGWDKRKGVDAWEGVGESVRSSRFQQRQREGQDHGSQKFTKEDALRALSDMKKRKSRRSMRAVEHSEELERIRAQFNQHQRAEPPSAPNNNNNNNALSGAQPNRAAASPSPVPAVQLEGVKMLKPLEDRKAKPKQRQSMPNISPANIPPAAAAAAAAARAAMAPAPLEEEQDVRGFVDQAQSMASAADAFEKELGARRKPPRDKAPSIGDQAAAVVRKDSDPSAVRGSGARTAESAQAPVQAQAATGVGVGVDAKKSFAKHKSDEHVPSPDAVPSRRPVADDLGSEPRQEKQRQAQPQAQPQQEQQPQPHPQPTPPKPQPQPQPAQPTPQPQPAQPTPQPPSPQPPSPQPQAQQAQPAQAQPQQQPAQQAQPQQQPAQQAQPQQQPAQQAGAAPEEAPARPTIEPPYEAPPSVQHRKVHELTELYKVGNTLGRGGFSEVRKGVDLATGARVALKIITIPVFLKNRKHITMEVQVLGMLRHERLVQLVEVVSTDNAFVIVLELVEGGELFDRIILMKKLPEVLCRHVTSQVLDGLDVMHEKGLMHRDLKPENVLLIKSATNAQKDGVTLFDVKLADFGLATAFNTGTPVSNLAGTPEYAAPEVLRREPYGPQCDMWSLGVVLYVMLCGFPPFYGREPKIVVRKVKLGEYKFPKPHWDVISPEARDLVEKLLVVDPNERLSLQSVRDHPWMRGQKMRSVFLTGREKELLSELGLTARSINTESGEPQLRKHQRKRSSFLGLFLRKSSKKDQAKQDDAAAATAGGGGGAGGGGAGGGDDVSQSFRETGAKSRKARTGKMSRRTVGSLSPQLPVQRTASANRR